ncbi:MAG: T9SS type A sorting domain-containing protein, partial [Paludibacter sp.]|nr:T9SS type A sorting domain-containing protein [Paludibacter sp.]
ETENLKVFSSQNDVVVKNMSDIPGELTLYDIEGRMLQKFKFIANGVTTIPMNLPAGVYLAKGKTSQEEVMKRLLIKK